MGFSRDKTTKICFCHNLTPYVIFNIKKHCKLKYKHQDCFWRLQKSCKKVQNLSKTVKCNKYHGMFLLVVYVCQECNVYLESWWIYYVIFVNTYLITHVTHVTYYVWKITLATLKIRGIGVYVWQKTILIFRDLLL